MKLVLWIGDGANQKALANKIHALMPVHTIVLETRPGARRRTPGALLSSAAQRLFAPALRRCWNRLMAHYDVHYPGLPPCRIIPVSSINDPGLLAIHEALQPDLILVSGTSLIRKRLLALSPRLGIMNLHTGLSPYVKGGPNCTNWCIANRQFHLIGNTVMWLSEGIDSGRIISTEALSLTGEESFYELHLKVMEHAHDLFLRALSQIIAGTSIPGVEQDHIARGKTYYNKDWTLGKQRLVIRNFREFRSHVHSPGYTQARAAVITVPLTQ